MGQPRACADQNRSGTLASIRCLMNYPPPLREIIAFFEALPDDEKRENLILYADQAASHAPTESETYVLEDVRKDDECTDTVGIFLKREPNGDLILRVSLGAQVQTLTRAMTAILCEGLNGATPQEVADVPADFVPKIVGGQLVRVRSQTVYYVFGRIKAACQVLIRRERANEP